MYFIAVPLSYVSLWLNSYTHWLSSTVHVDKNVRRIIRSEVSSLNIILLVPMQGVLAAAACVSGTLLNGTF